MDKVWIRGNLQETCLLLPIFKQFPLWMTFSCFCLHLFRGFESTSFDVFSRHILEERTIGAHGSQGWKVALPETTGKEPDQAREN